MLPPLRLRRVAARPVSRRCKRAVVARGNQMSCWSHGLSKTRPRRPRALTRCVGAASRDHGRAFVRVSVPYRLEDAAWQRPPRLVAGAPPVRKAVVQCHPRGTSGRLRRHNFTGCVRGRDRILSECVCCTAQRTPFVKPRRVRAPGPDNRLPVFCIRPLSSWRWATKAGVSVTQPFVGHLAAHGALWQQTFSRMSLGHRPHPQNSAGAAAAVAAAAAAGGGGHSNTPRAKGPRLARQQPARPSSEHTHIGGTIGMGFSPLQLGRPPFLLGSC